MGAPFRLQLLHMCSHYSNVSSGAGHAAKDAESETIRVLRERRENYLTRMARARELVDELECYRRMLGIGVPVIGGSPTQMPKKDFYDND